MRWWPDIVLAVGLAAVFAVVVDLLRVGSRIRNGTRHLKNKLSERSVARLRKRIAELEQYRDRVALYLSSDRALYLTALGIILGVLTFISSGAIIAILDRLGAIPNGDILTLMPFAIAIVLAVYGMRLASLVTPEKVSELIATLDADIADLKAKLQAQEKVAS